MFDKFSSFLSPLLHWRIRLLPVIIFCTCLILTVKISHIVDYVANVRALDVGPAAAQSTERAPPPAGETSKFTAHTLINVPDKKEIDAFDPLNMTPEEFRLLQELAKRKSQLTPDSFDINQKKSDRDAINNIITEKTREHTRAKNELKKMLEKVDHEESVGVKRLIKMTESMKPKEAAPILEGVDFPILIQIMEGIKETSASKILAHMDPKKASYLLTEMGRRKQILAKKN